MISTHDQDVAIVATDVARPNAKSLEEILSHADSEGRTYLRSLIGRLGIFSNPIPVGDKPDALPLTNMSQKPEVVAFCDLMDQYGYGRQAFMPHEATILNSYIAQTRFATKPARWNEEIKYTKSPREAAEVLKELYDKNNIDPSSPSDAHQRILDSCIIASLSAGDVASAASLVRKAGDFTASQNPSRDTFSRMDNGPRAPFNVAYKLYPLSLRPSLQEGRLTLASQVGAFPGTPTMVPAK